MLAARPIRIAGAVAVTLCAAPALLAQPSVVGRASVDPFFQAALSSRVDIVMMGDSNQIHSKGGWDQGITEAIAERYPLYASGLMPVGENDGNTMGMGFTLFSFAGNSVPQFKFKGAPAAHNTYMNPDIGLQPQNYAYIASGEAGAYTNNYGLVIENNSALDNNAHLRFHLVHGTFATGAEEGSFRLAVRLQEIPYSQLAVAAQTKTVTGVDGAAVASVDLPAGSGNKFLNFRYVPAGTPETQDLVGPFIGYYHRAENVDRTTGIAASTLYAFGQQSARDMASTMVQASNVQLSLYFQNIRSLQSGPRHVLVRICSGVNDLNEPLPSVGPNQYPGNSPEAFRENIQTILDRFTSVWSLNGWPADELYFMITVSPPIADPDEPKLIAYREQAEALSLAYPRTAVVRMDQLTTRQEIVNNGWGLSFDPFHLTLAGFQALGSREVDAWRHCAADLDENDVLNIDDFVAFQTLYALSHAAADFNDDGSLDIIDFIDFQTRYAIGC